MFDDCFSRNIQVFLENLQIYVIIIIVTFYLYGNFTYNATMFIFIITRHIKVSLKPCFNNLIHNFNSFLMHTKSFHNSYSIKSYFYNTIYIITSNMTGAMFINKSSRLIIIKNIL